MSFKWIVIACACACGGAQDDIVYEPAAPQPQPLPTVSASAREPVAPPPIAQVVERGDFTLVVSFDEARKHPEAPRVDAVLRGAPAWRAFPTIDPVRDLEWLVQHNDDIVVKHVAPDARVDMAIEAVAKPTTVGTPGVKAWRGVVNDYDTVFLRAQPQVVRIVRAVHAEDAARDLAAHAPTPPAFHTNEALRVRSVHPSASLHDLPSDISEARAWIDSRIADSGADVYVEADCPDVAAARADAAVIASLIRRKNSFPVRIVTAGLFNNVEVTVVDKQVHIHVRATQQQLESLITFAASMR